MVSLKNNNSVLIKSEKQYRILYEELLESYSIKELLLDIILHDLNNPLSVIKGFAELGLDLRRRHHSP